MRPVRLEMHGFAAFREPTVVDFTGAEYFALVGATGSGKSTVIDALTFALYGTVPRWDDRRAVALGLAPSVSRGVVRLVFDARDARFVAVRELRRTARGGVNVKNARLERLLDPDDLDGDSEVLAADSGVTRAVEELLGLPFEHFTSCVVLPQGEFAEFLHAKPADRQAILTRLLGLGVYERIARDANREAATQGERAALLAEQLSAYADATDAAVTAATGRVGALEALSDSVAELVPDEEAATAAVAEADAVVTALHAERARLTALAPPGGLAALDDRRREAEERRAVARARFSDAEAADDAARKLLADAPARAPLEQARRDHAELAAAVAAQPRAAVALAAAAEAERMAARRVRAAEDSGAAAVAAREAAAAAHAAAQSAVDALTAERALLAGLRAPAGLDSLAARRGKAVAVWEAAVARAIDADAAEAAARVRWAGAPARGPLEQARRHHAALAAATTAEPGAAARCQEAEQARADAAAVVAQARSVLADALTRRDEGARGDLAAALRPALVVGDACPVCSQEVAVLPAALPGVDTAALDAAVAGAQAELEAALAGEADTVASERHAAAERGRVANEMAGLLAAAAGTTAAGVDDELAHLDAAQAAVAEADAAAREARREQEAAARAVEALRERLAEAGGALRAARDPLVPLGVPAPGDDPVDGWAALTSWAAAELAEREAALPAARMATAEARDAAAAAARTADAAVAAAGGRRREETVAARTEQQARSRVEALDERIAALHAALSGAPDARQVNDDLARLDALEIAARDADAELRAARADRTVADERAEAVRREVAAGWDALRTARDPLVPLGAPGVAGDDLGAAWAEIAAWAAAQAAHREDALPGAVADAAAARATREAIAHRLATALAEAGVIGPDVAAVSGRPAGVVMSGRRAEAAVAAALAGARAGRDRLAERRAEAASKRAALAEAEEAQQVAKMLGTLLRSDRFPRWLVASALDALVADASAGLAELSGGQFELTHDDGEFLVVDHADADALRPVKTLSGGETFQASLALALALSAQMATLAADGAARLDSIFLDEGFGTLDEANLDVVAGTLENLASRGDRMVGVITHVPGLAERVPVRFAVRRDQRSARIEREG